MLIFIFSLKLISFILIWWKIDNNKCICLLFNYKSKNRGLHIYFELINIIIYYHFISFYALILVNMSFNKSISILILWPITNKWPSNSVLFV